MRQSATFHGQIIDPLTYKNIPSDNNNSNNNKNSLRRNNRPVSYTYGTPNEQIYIESQLRVYAEQLKLITESVRRYSEQTKKLSELKKQQQQLKLQINNNNNNLNNQKNLSQNSDNEDIDEDVQTPSHQLKLFLDNIRNSMKEPSEQHENEGAMKIDNNSYNNGDNNEGKMKNTSNVEAKTPSDQLRQFLDAIRSNKIPEDPPLMGNTVNCNMGSIEGAVKLRNNVVTKNQETIEMDNKDKLAYNISNTAKTVDQILDNFHLISSDLKDKNSFEYLKKYSDALKKTSEQIRLLNQNYGNCNGNNYCGSPDDSSCSTTPNSIKEAVQNLLSQPRNGFQIMDDRMSLFIDILDGQDRFSQVKRH